MTLIFRAAHTRAHICTHTPFSGSALPRNQGFSYPLVPKEGGGIKKNTFPYRNFLMGLMSLIGDFTLKRTKYSKSKLENVFPF